MTGKFKIAAVAIFSAIIGVATSSSRAASTVITINSGDTYDGWTIEFPQGYGVSLLQDVDSSGMNLVLEKFADFQVAAPTAIPIVFVQAAAAGSVSPTITITDESITNGNPGQPNWSGFEFSIDQDNGPNPISFSSVFVPPTAGGVDYTGVSTSPTSVTYTGSQPYGTTSLWGEGIDAGQLVINANPSSLNNPQAFTFIETPLTVPVPAAAWTGLTGLVGLGLLASAKKLKKILA